MKYIYEVMPELILRLDQVEAVTGIQKLEGAEAFRFTIKMIHGGTFHPTGAEAVLAEARTKLIAAWNKIAVAV